jgi:hypothetical protein
MPEIGQSLSHYSITEKISNCGIGGTISGLRSELLMEMTLELLPEKTTQDAD